MKASEIKVGELYRWKGRVFVPLSVRTAQRHRYGRNGRQLYTVTQYDGAAFMRTRTDDMGVHWGAWNPAQYVEPRDIQPVEGLWDYWSTAATRDRIKATKDAKVRALLLAAGVPEAVLEAGYTSFFSKFENGKHDEERGEVAIRIDIDKLAELAVTTTIEEAS